ncbi:Deoxyuridine 5'-triphosphate nucleotidohydrolase [Dissostichus eleginoides]|uniref:Deoxyuridine 5'-triphosphate nucleotidohydrolase n=1 Tax=Dissostichus eleginoides TaxID=100907 RepID=A0AAD9BWX3_DISEL|nr:Deoxyuridine 5'-triphosphate nucleotidohydrolase [Dissostichus eleginoides]
MTLLLHSELGDTYPLAAYFVEGKRMMDLVALKVVIEHRSEKLLLSSGIPSTVEQLHETVKETFGLIDFTQHYLDEDLDAITSHSILPTRLNTRGKLKF